MTQMMKALVKAKAEKGLWMQEVPRPSIAPNEVLIKIERSAICGTDMHIYKWDDWAQNNVPVGLITGHEYGGEVVEIGSTCLLYTSPSPRDGLLSRMPSSA